MRLHTGLLVLTMFALIVGALAGMTKGAAWLGMLLLSIAQTVIELQGLTRLSKWRLETGAQ